MDNQIFKEEQELLYLYMVLSISSKYGNLDEVIRSNNPNLGGSELRLIGTSRLAFVGDMQEKFDGAYQCNNMKKFAESAPMIPSHMIVYDYVYIPINPIKYFIDKHIEPKIYRLKKKISLIKKRIKKFFSKKEKFSIGENVINNLDFRIKNDSNENF